MTKKLFDRYMSFVNENKDLTPEFKYIPLTEKQNSFQYVGGQISNGNLYSIVNSSGTEGAGKIADFD